MGPGSQGPPDDGADRVTWSVIAHRPRRAWGAETLEWTEVPGATMTIAQAHAGRRKGRLIVASRHTPDLVELLVQPALHPAQAQEPKRHGDGSDAVRDQIRAAAGHHGSVRSWSIAQALPQSSVANFMRGEVRTPSPAILTALAASETRSTEQHATEIA